MFEIYYKDLTEEAKKRYLEFAGVESTDNLNDEICALAILETVEETIE